LNEVPVCGRKGDTGVSKNVPFIFDKSGPKWRIESLKKRKSLFNCQRARAGSEMALPFLFISFGNHQLPDHLATEDK
jgi:hypothetical protein